MVIWKQAEERGCLVHLLHRLRLVVAHVDVGLVDAQRAARERLAELSGEGEGGKLVRREARCKQKAEEKRRENLLARRHYR